MKKLTYYCCTENEPLDNRIVYIYNHNIEKANGISELNSLFYT